eukprot:179868_1
MGACTTLPKSSELNHSKVKILSIYTSQKSIKMRLTYRLPTQNNTFIQSTIGEENIKTILSFWYRTNNSKYTCGNVESIVNKFTKQTVDRFDINSTKTNKKIHFGSYGISKGEYMKWKIKITKHIWKNGLYNTFIGICAHDEIDKYLQNPEASINELMRNSYTLCVNSRIYNKNKYINYSNRYVHLKSLTIGDIIEVYLDMTNENNSNISFKLNDKNLGIVFNKIIHSKK